MENVKELQKKALIEDISGLIAEQKRLIGEAVAEIESRFMSGKDCDDVLDRMKEASFREGFLGVLLEGMGDMGIKQAILRVLYHAYCLKKRSVEDNDSSYGFYKLSVMLEQIADRAEERRKWEIEPAEAAA